MIAGQKVLYGSDGDKTEQKEQAARREMRRAACSF